ncbi:MAG: carbon-nitrogen hydrolase family protein [Planctomycetales bacterium]|nr:carbon-nitrogen hydrolase family protein [Planctomycetales bacterium]
MTDDRRHFLKGAAAGGAAISMLTTHSQLAAADVQRRTKLPREVTIATLCQAGIQTKTMQQMIERLIGMLDEAAHMQPDIVCLPETFHRMNVSQPEASIQEAARSGVDGLAEPLAKWAADNRCYVICPIHTRDSLGCYNSAIVIDRNGGYVGEYRKSHATTSEMDGGVKPGSLKTPVFETDFGKIGIQICFDIQWDDGWRNLRDQGAEIVFWPSAFGGGQMVNTRAWQNQYAVVSSTAKGTSKICDIDGAELATTNHWQRWVSATINLEKSFMHTWPYVQQFPAILRKYGSAIRINSYADEEWSIIESLSPELKVADVMREFGLKTIREHLAIADQMQCDVRGS